MITVDINRAARDLRWQFSTLSDKDAEVAIMRAINRTLTMAKTATSKEIRKVYNIKAGNIKEALLLKKASRASLSGYITISGSPLPIIAFGARQTSKGVSFAIMKGKRTVLPGAFITNVGNHRGVFAKGSYKGKAGFDFRKHRLGKAPKFTKRGIKAYPDLNINEMRTVSLPKAFANQAIKTSMQRIVTTNYMARLEHEMAYLTKRMKPA